MGFFTARFVEAADGRAAEIGAADLIKQELKSLLGGKERGDAMLMMHLNQIHGIDEPPENAPGFGYTWFPMKN